MKCSSIIKPLKQMLWMMSSDVIHGVCLPCLCQQLREPDLCTGHCALITLHPRQETDFVFPPTHSHWSIQTSASLSYQPNCVSKQTWTPITQLNMHINAFTSWTRTNSIMCLVVFVWLLYLSLSLYFILASSGLWQSVINRYVAIITSLCIKSQGFYRFQQIKCKIF